MKTLASFFCVLLFCVLAGAQPKPCNLTLKDSPVVRNLKLGSSKQLVGQIIARRNVGNFTFLYREDLAKLDNFNNVSEVFMIFDEQNLLDNLVITYDPSAVQWTDAKVFAKNLSENFNLPYAYWNFPVEDKAQATMSCTDFYVQIYSTLNQVFLKTLNQKTATGNNNAARAPTVNPRNENSFKP